MAVDWGAESLEWRDSEGEPSSMGNPKPESAFLSLPLSVSLSLSLSDFLKNVLNVGAAGFNRGLTGR